MSRLLKVLLGLFATLAVVALALGFAFYRNPIWFSDELLREKLLRQHVHSRYLEVDGYRLHYLEAAPPDGSAGTPLVLVHGLGARAEDWAPLIPSLAAHGFHVYAPDLLGYGRSPRPDVDYSISLQEKTVVDFAQQLGLGRFDLAGWSMGGWIALKLTLDHPGLVERLVAMDSAGIYFPATFDSSLFTPNDAAGLNHLIEMLSPQPHSLPPFVERAAIRKLQANVWVLDRSTGSMISGRDLVDFELQNIHVPTLIVWGREDRLIPLAVGETMHRQIGGSSLVVVDGCGHLAPAECYKPVLKATLSFLTTTPSNN